MGEGEGERAEERDYRKNNYAPWQKEGGEVITSKLLDVEVAGWQLCKNIRNVQLSSLKHHHYAYQSFSKRGGVEQCVTARLLLQIRIRGYLSCFSQQTKSAIQFQAAFIVRQESRLNSRGSIQEAGSAQWACFLLT